jgi:hypothetical protein
MPGAPDPLYVLARRVLLDALDALGEHRGSFILVGAQAIYFHTGEAEIAVPAYTEDADLALDPRSLKREPLLEELLRKASFRPGANPGTWLGTNDVEVDLMVPELLGGGGRRGARLPPHGNRVARKAKGLEAALVDHDGRRIASLEPDDDQREHDLLVAGPTALLVAKLHKIADRLAAPERSQDKDAYDILRLLRAVPLASFVDGVRRLRADAICSEVTDEGVTLLEKLFTGDAVAGAQMAARAAEPLENTATVLESCRALAGDLLTAIGSK